MYILRLYHKGIFTEHEFVKEYEFGSFVDGFLYGLDVNDINYTFIEEINEIEGITKLKITIL